MSTTVRVSEPSSRGAKVPACSQYPAQRASTSRKEYSASAGIRGVAGAALWGVWLTAVRVLT